MLFSQIFNNSWKERRQQALSIYFCLQFGSDRIVNLTEWKCLISLNIERIDSRFNGRKYFKLVSFKKWDMTSESFFSLFFSEKKRLQSIWAWMWRRKRFWRSWISYLKGKFTKFWILKVLWHEQPYMAVTHWGRIIYQLAIEFTFHEQVFPVPYGSGFRRNHEINYLSKLAFFLNIWLFLKSKV